MYFRTIRVVLLLILCLLGAVAAYATGQEPDRIIFDGKQRELFSNPLEDYYANGKRRPRFMIEPLTTSSGNWRGYVATWQIDDGKLYLTDITAWLCNGATVKSCKKVTLNQIFPGKVQGGKVFAAWYSDELRVPDGERLQYVHMGYGSTYERDIIFTIKNGHAKGPFVIDHSAEKLPSELESTRKELAKLKASEDRKDKPPKAKVTKKPKSGITITPGQGIFKVGTSRAEMERILGDGEASSTYDDVYFVEYPLAGVQVSYERKSNSVHVIFLYKNSERYERFVVPKVLTDKGISWDATEEDVIRIYGKAPKDYSDESKSWRRLEYPGIDFLFQGGSLGRIGILGPDGN